MLGFGTITRKVFGSANDRAVKAVRPVVEAINALEAEHEALSLDRVVGPERGQQHTVAQ